MAKRVLLLMPLLVACDLFEKGGNSTEGWFRIEPAVSATAGTKLDLAVIDHEANGVHVVSSVKEASFPDGAGAIVDDVEGDVVRISATAAGGAALSFTAVADDEDRQDSYMLNVIEPRRLVPKHLCSATYVKNQAADVWFSFTDEARVPGQGYGYYPVDVENAALVESESTAFTMRLQLGGQDATITSTLFPPNEAPGSLTLMVVDQSMVDGVELIDASTGGRIMPGTRLNPGDKRVIRVVPTVNGQPACGAVIESRVSTSEDSSCRLSNSFTGPLSRSAEGAAVQLVLVAAEYGICELSYELIEEGLEAVATGTLDFDLAEPRSSGSGGGGGFDFD